MYWWIPPQLQPGCSSEDEGRAEPTVEEVVSEGRLRGGACANSLSPRLPPPSPGHEDTVQGTASTFIREPSPDEKRTHAHGGLLPGEGLSWDACGTTHRPGAREVLEKHFPRDPPQTPT